MILAFDKIKTNNEKDTVYLYSMLVKSKGNRGKKNKITIYLYNNQINAHALIGQSAMVYYAGIPMQKSRLFWVII